MPRKLSFDIRWKRRRKRRGWWLHGRKLLAILLVALGIYWLIYSATPPADGIALRQPFSLCSARNSAACVIDGDTIMIGQRKIRMQGYNSPEVDGACPAERELAGKARQALLTWLNDGAIRMDSDADMARDQYGRELRRFWKLADDGQAVWLADHMTEAGLARGERDWSRDWC